MATPGEPPRKRSESRNRIPSRPTTPLRSVSRTSLREGHDHHGEGTRSGGQSAFPLDALEPAFAEMADSAADLEANFMHLQLMHESLARFSEDFASFLYGLNMNAFCVDFPEVMSDSYACPSFIVICALAKYGTHQGAYSRIIQENVASGERNRCVV